MDRPTNELHPKFKIHVGLVHWPVLDRAGNTVCTNITNFDIMDIARVSRSLGIETYTLINRVREQLMFTERIVDHWKTGYGTKYNPKRASALGMVKTAETLQDCINSIDPKPLVIATAARDLSGLPLKTFRDVRQQLEEDSERPILLVFGTGFGLHEDVFDLCDWRLEPIRGASSDDYRHLSVRSAVSICLDRLISTW